MSERVREALSWLTAIMLAGSIVGGIGLWYWSTVQAEAPSRTLYQHPHFVSRYVESREAAQTYEILDVRPGQRVWRWVEYCLDEPASGTVTVRWVGEHYRRFGAQFPNWGEVGCHEVATSTYIPDDAPLGREVSMIVTVEFPREVVGSLYNRNPPVTAMVTK